MTAGYLRSISDRHGNTLSLKYTNLRIASIADGAGRAAGRGGRGRRDLAARAGDLRHDRAACGRAARRQRDARRHVSRKRRLAARPAARAAVPVRAGPCV